MVFTERYHRVPVASSLVLVLFLLFCARADARQQSSEKANATNVNLEIRVDTCIITYDLFAPPEAQLEVFATLVKENDPSFKVPVKAATGHIGRGSFAGTNRQIRWAWRQDLPSDFAGGSEYSVNIDARMLTSGGGLGLMWRPFAAPNFGANRLGLDITYYGNASTANTYSAIYLSPLIITASYAVLENVALQISYTRLSGDYKLKVPITRSISNLLVDRQHLWGNGMGSTGLGYGLCARFWSLRIGGQIVNFSSRDTDMSPKSMLFFTGDVYVTGRIYLGLAFTMYDQAGLIAPIHVGTTIAKEDQGISREGIGSPNGLVFRLGVDAL